MSLFMNRYVVNYCYYYYFVILTFYDYFYNWIILQILEICILLTFA